ncbi:MAG: ribonuclease P protein component [Candidatus Cardinium sp.]|nr:ribonuclease P protein component [Candidatus Cardinium sp.]
MNANKLSHGLVNHRLTKHDRLTNRQHIKLLFEEGSCLKFYPFKVFFIKKEKKHFVCNQMLCAVPKKHFSSVARNRIKRLLKEAYRLHKHILDRSSEMVEIKFVFLIGYVYTGDYHKLSYAVIRKCVTASLYQLRTLLKQGQ